jgi:dTDP-4-dehydrorhamnose 3,5-epimerase-like enzyme
MVTSISTSIPSPLEPIDLDPVPIPGVAVHPLSALVDDRGSLTEIFRSTWGLGAMHQWTALTLGKRVVRGPSVHRRHCDAVITLAGELQIGMRDLREKSPAFLRAFRLTLSTRRPALVLIPPGVMHAFYAATEPTLVLVGNTHEYDPDDDIKCRWQDVPLDLDESVLGTHDERARPLDDVLATLRALT